MARYGPTLQEARERTERGIIDDTITTIRPSAEEREVRRAEAKAYLAQRPAEKARAEPLPPAEQPA